MSRRWIFWGNLPINFFITARTKIIEAWFWRWVVIIILLLENFRLWSLYICRQTATATDISTACLTVKFAHVFDLVWSTICSNRLSIHKTVELGRYVHVKYFSIIFHTVRFSATFRSLLKVAGGYCTSILPIKTACPSTRKLLTRVGFIAGFGVGPRSLI